MDDTLLVSRAMAGDLDSFGQLYDRYFPRVYDFAWRVLKDGGEAASVTESVFATAMTSLAALPNAASFRSWLFTIAYRAAVGRAANLGRTGGRPEAVHEEAFGSFDVPDACFVEDPSVAGGDPETAAQVWEAATALNPRDYAVLDLHVRQGLDSAELASVLAMNKGNAYTLVNRMKAAASDVMVGYIVARKGNQDCDGLQQALAPFDFPPYTDQVRRAVDAHVRECETCKATRKTVPEPLAILGAFAAVKPPMSLKGDVWRSIVASWHMPRAQAAMVTAAGDVGLPGGGAWVPAALSAGGGIGLGGGGFGGGAAGAADGASWDRKRVLWFAGAAGGMLLFAFAIGTVLVMAVGGGGDGGGGASGTKTPTATRTATAIVSLTPGVAVSSPTPETPSPVPTDTETPPPPTDTPVPSTATNTPPGKPKTATPSPVKTSGAASATPTAKKTVAPPPTP